MFEILLYQPHKATWVTPATRLLGVRLRHFSTTCAVYIEDCEGWWLSSCHSSVADTLTAQTRCPWLDSRWLPAFSLSSIFASKNISLDCMPVFHQIAPIAVKRCGQSIPLALNPSFPNNFVSHFSPKPWEKFGNEKSGLEPSIQLNPNIRQWPSVPPINPNIKQLMTQCPTYHHSALIG